MRPRTLRRFESLLPIKPRWPTADQSAEVSSVFDPTLISAAIGWKWSNDMWI